MTIQIELNPDLERRLAAEARMHGMDLEGYAEQILHDAIVGGRTSSPRASREEFRRFLDALAHLGKRRTGERGDLFARDNLRQA